MCEFACTCGYLCVEARDWVTGLPKSCGRIFHLNRACLNLLVWLASVFWGLPSRPHQHWHYKQTPQQLVILSVLGSGPWSSGWRVSALPAELSSQPSF